MVAHKQSAICGGWGCVGVECIPGVGEEEFAREVDVPGDWFEGGFFAGSGSLGFGAVGGRGGVAHCGRGREKREGRIVDVEEVEEAEELSSSTEGGSGSRSLSSSGREERSCGGMGGLSGRCASLAFKKSFWRLLMVRWGGGGGAWRVSWWWGSRCLMSLVGW